MRAAFYGKKVGFGEGEYILPHSYLVLFFIAATISAITMLATQVEKGIMYDAAVMQLLIGGIGMMAGLSFVMMGLYKIRKDTNEDISNYGLWGLIGFVGARVAGALISSVEGMSSVFIANFTIVITAAIMEEALFSLALSTLIYIATKPILEKIFGEEIGNIIAIVVTGGIVSYAFAMFHLGVYGTEFAIMLYLAVSRFVYTLIYLASRNIMSPVLAHILHNALLMFMLV